jgi:hypothetical protein
MTDEPTDADAPADGADDDQDAVDDPHPVSSSLRSAQHRTRETGTTDDEQAEPEPADSETSSETAEVDALQPVATSLRSAQQRAGADDAAADATATERSNSGARDDD